MSQKWSPDSWRSKPFVQIPDFPDKEALKVVEERLVKLSATGFCR